MDCLQIQRSRLFRHACVSGNISDQASAAFRLTKACQEENIPSFLQAELSLQFLKIWASNIERVKPDLAHRGCKSQLLGSNLQTPCGRGGISSASVISSQLGKGALIARQIGTCLKPATLCYLQHWYSPQCGAVLSFLPFALNSHNYNIKFWYLCNKVTTRAFMWNKWSQQSMFEVIIHVGRLCLAQSISILEKIENVASQNTIKLLILSPFMFRESADSRWGQASLVETVVLHTAGGPPILCLMQQLQLEPNWRGKKAQQGCKPWSLRLCAAARAKCKWEIGEGTMCRQINVHLDCLLKRVQRVQHNTLFRMKPCLITHELQRRSGAPVLLRASEVSEDLWDAECEGNTVAVESVIRGVEWALAVPLLSAVLFSVLKISKPPVGLIRVVFNQYHGWF